MLPLNTFKRRCLVLAVTQAIAVPLHAATITVDTTSDTQASGICTLRAAITAANTNAPVDGCNAGSLNGRDTINLTALPNNSTITLNSELPTVVSTISLNGPGQNSLTISGNNSSPIISVADAGNLTVSSISLSNGRSDGDGGAIEVTSATLTINESTVSDNSAADYGGGVFSKDSNVTINNSTFSGNSTAANGLEGGAIASRSASTTTINNSTLSNNYAVIGGGIWSLDSRLTISNSTLSDNSALYGGGIFSNRSTTVINNSTLTNNSAVSGGGVITNLSTLTFSNTIIAGNVAAEAGVEIRSYDINTLSLQNNVLGSSQSSSAEAFDGFTPNGSNIMATNDRRNLLLNRIIEPLANNGGTTLTHALPTTSPAISNANTSRCPATDQLGNLREDAFFIPIVARNSNIAVVDLGDNCDIGAIEFSADG